MRTFAAFPVCALAACAAAAAQPGSWPMPRRDLQRSAFTDEVVSGPYERKWFRDFHAEMIATRVEAVIAGGRCFVGTLAGSMYALDAADGRTVWRFGAEGAIGASPCYADGRLFFGDDAGNLYCLSADDGRQIWRYRAAGGVWASPAVAAGRVYVGDRAGVLHAVSADTGRGEWTFRCGGMVLAPCSLPPQTDRIVFACEDMHVYCLDLGGRLLWKSAKLGGLSLRDYAPVVWQGLAIVRTNPANGFHQCAGQNPAVLTRAQKALPLEPDDKVIQDRWGQYTMKLTPRRLAAERRAILEFLAANPHEKTFYAFNLADGKEPWTAPVLYTGGLHNPAPPPTFNAKTGELYTWAPTALSNYSAGVPGGAIAVGRLDRATGLVDILWHANGDRLGWSFDFAAPADETQTLSLMGGILLNTHQGIIGGMSLDTLRWHRVYIARDSYGGIFGPAFTPGSFRGADKAHAQGMLTLMCNEWHGPARSSAAIAENRFFWIAGSQVVCIGGPDTPRTDTGGTKPPPPVRRTARPVVPGGNVASGDVGGFDPSVAPPRISADQVRRYLAPPAPAGQAPAHVRDALAAAVDELISEPAWAPFIVQLGISGEDRYFWRTAETMRTVALAAPHLPATVAERARAYLHAMFDAGCPFSQPVHRADGRRREPYDLGPQMKKVADSTPRYAAGVEDMYAVWAFAHCADGWNKVLANRQSIERVFDGFAARPVAFDHADRDNDAAEHLNAQIAGVLGCARIFERAGDAKRADRALGLLAELLTARVHHELADTAFVRPTKTAAYKLHQAKIPRYLELTPEICAMLREFCGEALKRNLLALSEQLPIWHHAFGERLIGGENYISPPTLARGLFMALADGEVASPEFLARRLDQPWCRADLYYIEKLTGLARRAGR